jgi:hypothetical protein
MDEQEAKALFRQAADVYKDGDYKDALKIFDRLDAAFPNNERIMFPRARCFAKLGRTGEAVAICDVLIAQYGHKSAAELRGKLVSGEFKIHAPPGTEDTAFDPLDLNVDEKLASAFDRIPKQTAKRKVSAKVIVAIAIAAALLLIGVPLLLGDGGSAEETPAEAGGEYVEPPTDAAPPAVLPEQGDAS